ncbi:hypothetical protein UFO1_1493 [Pelosinus sp. UFO1]|nr:hypothetical protein UFO1_1493 [Pelosinus sp. UFO1]
MNLGRQHENWIDDTVLEFPRTMFWMIHVIGTVIIFILGMRFAFNRAPVPMVAYRLLRRLMH